MLSKLKKSYVDAKEEPIYSYDNVYESWSYCMTLYMTHWNKLRGHFGALPDLPLSNSVSGCFRRFRGKSLKQRERLKRHSHIFLVGKFQAEIRISCLQTYSWILFSGFRSRFSLKRNWLRQMVNAITERNQNSSVLNSVHHLPAQTVKRPVYPCKKYKSLVPKSLRYTASSHRYLPLRIGHFVTERREAGWDYA